MNKTTDRRTVQKFEDLMGLSEELDRTIEAIRNNELLAPSLYKNYILPRLNSLTPADSLLASKILGLFTESNDVDFRIVSVWVDDLLRYLPVINASVTDTHIDTFIARSPIPVHHAYVSLQTPHVKTLSDRIAAKRLDLRAKYAENEVDYREMMDAVSKLGLATAASSAINRSKIVHLDVEQIESLKKAADLYAQTTAESCETKMKDLLATHHNRIVTGFLPDDEIKDLLKTFHDALENISALYTAELIDSTTHNRIAQLKEDLLYLQTAEIKLSVTPSENIKKLRVEYEAARKQISDEEMRIQELIANIEDMVTDTADSEAVDLFRTQIQEVESTAVDQMDVDRTEKLVSKVNTQVEDEAKAREFAQNMSAVNIPTLAEMKAMKMLRHVLANETIIRNGYVDTVTKMIGNVLRQISEGIPPSDDIASRISNVIEHLPADAVRSDLLTSMDTVSQLLRRVRLSISQKHSLQSLEDVIAFFSEHRASILNMVKLSWGQPLGTLYRKLQREYAMKIAASREAEWIKRAKEADVDSPQALQRILDAAPNRTVLEKMAPELHARLRKRMENEAERRAADQKRLYEEMKKKFEHDLKTVSESFASITPSVFSSIDLGALHTSAQKLSQDDRKPRLKAFNVDLAKALNSVDKEMTKVEFTLILTVLKGSDPQDVLQNAFGDQKHVDTLLKNTHTLLTQAKQLLVPENEKALHALSRRLVVTNHLRTQWRDPRLAFSATPYETAYRNYMGLLQEITERTGDVRNYMLENYETVSKNLHDRSSHTEIAIKPEDPFTKTFRETVKSQPEPFSGELETAMKVRENGLRDVAMDLHIKLKTKLDHLLARRNSEEARWREMIIQYRIRVPDGLDVDTKKLTSEPVLTLNKLITLAEQNLPYIEAKRALGWTSEFILAAIGEKNNSTSDDATALVTQLATLHGKCQDAARKIDEKIAYNTHLETEMLSNSEDTTESLSDLQLMLAQVEPRRIVGGEKRHRILHDTLLARQNKLSYAEEVEKLSARYFELARDLREFRYGINFDTQSQKIEHLKSELAPLGEAKKKGGSKKDSDVLLPEERTDDQVPVPSLLAGLSCLDRYVAAQRTLLDNLISAQPLVSQTEAIPAFMLQKIEIGAEEKSRLDLSKLSACDVNTGLVRCIDVFGERRVMTVRGIQLYLYATHGNFIFEAFSHTHGRSIPASKDTQGDSVTTRYRSVTVIASIAATLQAFWTEISAYDIRDVLDGAQSTTDKRINSIINLKLFVYLTTVAWSQSVPPLETGHPGLGSAREATLLDFATLMAALHPEYAYATTAHPINATMAALVEDIRRDTLDAAMNTHENPPDQDMSELKAFCADTKTWRKEDVRRYMWHSDLIRQICTGHPRARETATATKLFLYALSVSILPRDVLRCLWTQFRPLYATDVPSLEDLVSALSYSFFKSYATTTETISGRLNTGERLERQLTLRLRSKSELLEDFSKQEAVLDYILGSYVFGVPLTCGIHVANIINGRYRLVIRHLENVPGDPDFTKVLRSRDLTFSQVSWSRTVLNPVERVWFSLQEDRLRDLLQNPIEPPSTPLIIYDSSTNYVVQTLIPPLKSAPPEHVYLHVKNPFSALRLPPVLPDTNAADLSLLPINIDFLRRDPPNPTEPHESDIRDSIPEHSLDEPLFSQSKISSIVPRDAVTTISAESISEIFNIHPFRALSSAIRMAIEILRETKHQLETFETDIQETIRRIKILYLH